MKEYGVRDVVCAVLEMMGGRIVGLKKLTKLLFLTQYVIYKDAASGQIKAVKYLYGGNPITRAEFYIWTFGPMSNEVYDAVDELESEGVVDISGDLNAVVIIFKGERTPEVPEPVRRRISDVVRKYGGRKGWELERLVKKALGLHIEERRDEYLGYYVDDYLRAEGFELETRDLAQWEG